MVLFTVTCKDITLPFIVLNGESFHYKIQEIFLGKNKYRYYFTSNYDINECVIKVIDIDIKKEDINKELFKVYSSLGISNLYTPVRAKTLEKKYKRISVKEDFDFYQNLCDNYGVRKINQIIFLYSKKNVTAKWLSIYFDLDEEEIHFILKYLPCYYNFLGEV